MNHRDFLPTSHPAHTALSVPLSTSTLDWLFLRSLVDPAQSAERHGCGSSGSGQRQQQQPGSNGSGDSNSEATCSKFCWFLVICTKVCGLVVGGIYAQSCTQLVHVLCGAVGVETETAE